jgi:hypothetical protein
MPTETRLTSKKFFNKLENDVDYSANTSAFTEFLQANVLEEVRAEIEVAVGWYHEFGPSAILHITDGVGFEGYFQEDGIDWRDTFFEGDLVYYSLDTIPNGPSTICAIQSISGDKMEVSFNAAQSNTDPIPENSFLKGISQQTACTYKFGLIEQDESFNTLSKLTGTDQKFFLSGMNHTGPPGPIAGGIPANKNIAWLSGNVNGNYEGEAYDYDRFHNDNTFQAFKITNDFVVLPFIQDGEVTTNLVPVENPDLFKGSSTLKHVFSTSFQRAISNPNTEKTVEFEDRQGSVGWFNENFNGFPSNYEVQSISYSDAATSEDLDRISVLDVTRVNAVIKKTNGDFTASDVAMIGHCRVVKRVEYEINTLNWRELWVFQSHRKVEGTPSNGTGAIINCTMEIDGGDASLMNVQFDFSPSTEQRTLIQDDDYYVLTFNIQDFSILGENSDRVQLILDVNQYFKNPDIPGLLDFTKHELYKHPDDFEEGVSVGNTSLKVFNESGILVNVDFDLNFDLDPAIENPAIESVEIGIGARNSDSKDFFKIESEVLPADFTEVSGRQKVLLEDTRGYNLAEGDQFNLKVFKDVNSTLTEEFYTIQYGIKINWQSWIQLLAANEIFYDTSKSFNGFNKKSSNYSNVNNYDIVTFVIVNVFKDGVTTPYRCFSNPIQVADYEEEHDGQDNWLSCEVSTESLTGEDFNASLVNTEQLIIKWEYTPNPPFSPSADDYYAIIRVEETNQGGDDIDESSSIRATPTENRILLTTLSNNGSNLVAQCFTNPAYLNNSNYSISCEIDRKIDEVDLADFSGDFSLDFS